MTVFGVTGHQNIPKVALELISSRLDELFLPIGPADGVSSLAAGADQLFADAILRIGGHLDVIIPCRNYDAVFKNDDALEHYRALLEQARNIDILPYDEPSEDAFFEAGRQIVQSSDRLVAIWDGERAEGTGGTADVVKYAAQLGRDITIIWPDGLER